MLSRDGDVLGVCNFSFYGGVLTDILFHDASAIL